MVPWGMTIPSCIARATAAILPHLLFAHGVVDGHGLDQLYSPLRHPLPAA